MSLDGRTIKETQLGLFEVQHGELLERCRAAAIVYARRHGFVSINEVREAVTLPAGIHPSVLGAVFRCSLFRAIGYTEALHPAAHARVIRVYALKETSDGQ
jgi:hypothetical protein